MNSAEGQHGFFLKIMCTLTTNILQRFFREIMLALSKHRNAPKLCVEVPVLIFISSLFSLFPIFFCDTPILYQNSNDIS